VAERIAASAFEDPSYLPKLLVTLVKQGIDRFLRQLIEMHLHALVNFSSHQLGRLEQSHNLLPYQCIGF
jgi:hypothetical protein